MLDVTRVLNLVVRRMLFDPFHIPEFSRQFLYSKGPTDSLHCCVRIQILWDPWWLQADHDSWYVSVLPTSLAVISSSQLVMIPQTWEHITSSLNMLIINSQQEGPQSHLECWVWRSLCVSVLSLCYIILEVTVSVLSLCYIIYEVKCVSSLSPIIFTL